VAEKAIHQPARRGNGHRRQRHADVGDVADRVDALDSGVLPAVHLHRAVGVGGHADRLQPELARVGARPVAKITQS